MDIEKKKQLIAKFRVLYIGLIKLIEILISIALSQIKRSIIYIRNLNHRHIKYLYIMISVLILLFALSRCIDSRTQHIEFAPVEISKTTRSNITNVTTFSGTTQAYNAVKVAAQVTGQITAINFAQGKLVKQGDVLFEIDARKYSAQLKMAEASLAQDYAYLTLAEKDLARYQSLNAQKYVSDEQLDQARSKKESLLAAIAEDKAKVENAKLMLEYCAIKAPVNGVVGQINVTVGNIVQADGLTPITTIMQISPLYITFEVDSKTLDALRKVSDIAELPITIHTESNEEIQDAKLSFIDNSINSISGSTVVKAIYNNTDQKLWANQFVKISVSMNTKSNALIIPSNALLQNQDGYFVFAVDKDNLAHIKNVKIGMQNDNIAEILSGLQDDEYVVTSGQIRLSNGSRVKIINKEVVMK
jgi:multidrug efflux system membrane fusion protein